MLYNLGTMPQFNNDTIDSYRIGRLCGEWVGAVLPVAKIWFIMVVGGGGDNLKEDISL